MTETKTIVDWMTQRGMSQAQLVEAAGLDKHVVDAIVHARYTPSPDQRRRLATALGVNLEEIAWGHAATVEHIHGHGPQFGRSP